MLSLFYEYVGRILFYKIRQNLNLQKCKELCKKLLKTIKYQNIYIKHQLEQQNRFNKLFPKSKEVYMHLILKSIHAYCLFVKSFFAFYKTSPDYKQNILNFIFDPSIISPDMLGFIDEVMNAVYTVYPPFKGISFWTTNRKKLFHNYISNFDIE